MVDIGCETYYTLSVMNRTGGDDMRYKLREKREEAGLTQTELSEMAGVARQTIIAIEGNDMKVTTTSTLIKLAKAIGCSVTDLFAQDV